MSVSKHRDENILLKFGENLRRIRQKRGLSQMQLANEIDTSAKFIYQLEKGLVNPTLCTVLVLVKVLKIELTELIPHNISLQ